MKSEQKYQKYLNYEISRLEQVLIAVKSEFNRLKSIGYKDLRKLFVSQEQINNVELHYNNNTISVTCFGSDVIEKSPIDAFAMVQIEEIILWIENKLNYLEKQQLRSMNK